MLTKTTGKGLQRVTSRVWYITDPDKPCPREHAAKGARRCFREEEEKTRDARKNLFIWIAILSSNDSNGFSSLKIIKATVLNTVTRVALLCISLSLSLSLIQIVRSAPTNCSSWPFAKSLIDRRSDQSECRYFASRCYPPSCPTATACLHRNAC